MEVLGGGYDLPTLPLVRNRKNEDEAHSQESGGFDVRIGQEEQQRLMLKV